MKKLILLILVLLVLLAFFLCGADNTALASTREGDSIEDQLNDAVDEGLGNIDFSGVESIVGDAFDNGIVDKIQSILAGEFDSADSYLSFIFSSFFQEIANILPSIVSIAVICIVGSLVTTKQGGMFSQGTSNVVYLVCFSMVMVSVITALYSVYSRVYTAINSLAQITEVSVPILLTLMIANGANVTAKVYQPTVTMLTGGVVNIVSNILLPMCIFALVFTVISNLSNNVRVTKTATFLNSTGSWLLGTVFMVFFAFLSVQGITAMSIDGVSIRAAKFATKTYIPILGGYLADGFDLIIAGSTLIKNAFGVVVLIAFFSTILAPLLSLVVYNLALQLLSAVVEPIADSRFVSFFSSVGKNLTFMALLVIAVAFMFFLLITMAIYTANGVF